MADDCFGSVVRATEGGPGNADHTLVKSYFLERSAVFRDLLAVQNAVWSRPEVDDYFKLQRTRADSATATQKKWFFKMMRALGDQLQAQMDIIPLPNEAEEFKVLDICMAPGGYSATVLKHHRNARISALSLPKEDGGHDILLPNWKNHPRVEVELMDITMLSSEFGYPGLLPLDHPAASQFSPHRPFVESQFDLIFCDGQVLRSHHRALTCQSEPSRLITAQLILALQRIQPGGTIVLLLHRVHSPCSVRIIEAFSHFADINLVNPTGFHASRNSFYLVAKNLDPTNMNAWQLLNHLKNQWKVATLQAFGCEPQSNEIPELGGDMERLMDSFGRTILDLSEPLWEIQARALRKKFLKGRGIQTGLPRQC
ncbi:hypothetical protein LOZ53_004452 [Ophidiomyces ophidiicola]|nr:hypothetical protein LOZ55_006147 [Ophidiomyces ophidiicola]KAI1984074.1 hypothetical protein LOZ51_006759 [Ophidiomyces ophidiicola]KAI1985363.1 hypothetical protein LOZ54_004233 [Ophidiomyces ophidiicola]KAI1987122.1 hypothetical protein LOZ53_004452 [Ophidiomyces ophidiicola]